MARIKLDHLRPGMVVASAVQNLDEMLLIPARCVLSERHLGILRAWGITEVDVITTDIEGDSTGTIAQVVMADKAEMLNEMKARFCQYEEQNPVHQEILRLMMRRQIHPQAKVKGA